MVTSDRPIRTATTSFLRPAYSGPAEVSVELVRHGRAVTNLTVTLTQESRIVVVSQVTAADAVESTAWEAVAHLGLPALEECVPIAPPTGIGHFDHGVAMLDPNDLPFSHGPRARVAGYMRPIEPRPIDAPWLGMALDWFPPASFTRIDPPAGGISISYTIHVHRTLPFLGADEWLGGVFRADISAGAIALEKGLIADPSGRILAESFHTRWTAGPNQLPSV
jgi:acyl-CoA thioesterase